MPPNKKTNLTAYIASPYGFAEGTKYWYEQVLLPLISKYLTIHDPWSVDASHLAKAKPENLPRLFIEIGEQHFDTIKNKIDLVVAILDQEPPDNGTVAEVAWAAAHNIPVIGYRNDIRSSGEVGLPYNLMIGAAIKKSGGAEVSSLVELEVELQKLAKKPSKA